MKRKFLAILLCMMMSTPIYPMAIDQATFKVGQRFFEQGLYSEAEPRFLDIVRKYPDSPSYHQSLFYLGQTYAHLGKYKPALQYYKILLNKSKTVTEKQKALLGIAKSWLQLGVHDKAGDFYAFFAAEYPESEYAPAALYFSGIARERENKVTAAVEKYRTVLELYPDSDYYGKSIEKVAVLDSNTPESLWADSQVSDTVARKGSIDMFVDEIGEENVDFDEPVYTAQTPPKNRNIPVNQEDKEIIDDSDFEKTELKAQNISAEPMTYRLIEPTQQYQANTPTVLTQFIQSAPIVVTQTIRELVTQEPVAIAQETQNITRQTTPREEDQIQKLMDANIVQKIGDEYIPVDSTEEYQKKQTLAAYKKLWEEEYRIKLREQELENTKLQVKELARLSSEKAQILEVKEASLKEQQNRIHNNLYQDLSKNITNSAQKFDGPPIFTQGTPPPTPATPPIVVAPPVVEPPVNEGTYDAGEVVEEPAYDDEYATEDPAYDAGEVVEEATYDDGAIIEEATYDAGEVVEEATYEDEGYVTDDTEYTE